MSNEPSAAAPDRPAAHRDHRGDRADRVLALTIALASIAAALLFANELLSGLFRPWNDARLAPSAALLRGYALYTSASDPGLILSFIYGPIGPLLYLPALLLPTPTSAVAAGLCLTVAFVLAPAAWLVARTSRARGLPFAGALVLMALYCVYEGALRGPTFWIHVDAPALALSALACVALARSPRREAVRDAALSTTAIALAAVLGVLATFAKQVALPLGPGLALLLGFTAGARVALRFAAAWLVAFALASGLLAVAFDGGALYFNLVDLPAAHPWKQGSGGAALLRSSLLLATASLPLLALLGFDLAALRAQAPSARRAWLRRHPRLLPVAAALALVPTSVLGFVKVGAESNAHAYTLYFLAIAATGAVADAASRGPARPLARAVLVLASLGIAAVSLPSLASLPRSLRALPTNPESTGYAHALAHPDTTYFPYHPLIALMAEGRGTHVSYGLHDRRLGEAPVDDAHFRAHLPGRLRWIALFGSGDDSVLRRLPRFDERVSLASLPGWTVFAEPVPADPATAISERTR